MTFHDIYVAKNDFIRKTLRRKKKKLIIVKICKH